jgi:hypothetical protein
LIEPLFGPLQIVLLSSGTVIGCVGFFGRRARHGRVRVRLHYYQTEATTQATA